MDNRLFYVNGRTNEQLLKALELAFLQADSSVTGWAETKQDGFVLLCGIDHEHNNLPRGLNASGCLPIIITWLKSDFAKTVEYSNWCDRVDHDGDDLEGWQVYVNDWGKVGEFGRVVCAVKPAFLWMGK